MSTRSKRKQETKVSYAEVESDVDIEEEEKKVTRPKKNKGKARIVESDEEQDYEATAGSSSKKLKKSQLQDRSSTSPTPTEEPVEELTYDSKLLLNLPFDLFVELCSHLDGGTLLELAKVNKALRKTLLSRSARSIWSSLRRKLGYVLPDGMEELEFALLVHANNCQACGRKTPYFDVSTSFFLRAHLCGDCKEKHTIISKGIKKEWPDLRREALTCVRSAGVLYLITDLVKINEQLAELEEEDELTVSEIQSIRSKASSTRSRGRAAVDVDLKADAVERFVKERQDWVARETEVSRSMEINHWRLFRQAQADRDAKIAEAQKARLSILKALATDHGWTKEEVQRHERFQRLALAPKISIEDDPDAWETYHETIKEQLSSEAEEAAKADALEQRQSLVEPHYQDLEEEKSKWSVFPSFKNFLAFKTIRPFWESVDSTIDDKSWKKALTKIIKELDEYQEKNRVEAIRQILVATQGLASVTSLSKDPNDYPESTYDETFFARSTSLFVVKTRNRPIISPYPQTTSEGDYHGPASLKGRINVRQIHVIRSLTEAAGLDPDTSSISDLDALGRNFKWKDASAKKYRFSKLDWIDVIDEVMRYGPSNTKVVAGERIKVKYYGSASIEDSSADDQDDEDEDEGGEGDSTDSEVVKEEDSEEEVETEMQEEEEEEA